MTEVLNDKLYNLYYQETPNAFTCSPAAFCLHTHNVYEVLLFLEGNANYVIEDCSYTLEPYDVIVIRNHQLHCAHHNGPALYRRMILHISPEFFQEYRCSKYLSLFEEQPTKAGNKIPASAVLASGLYDAFLEYEKFSLDYTVDKDEPILISCIIKILYLLQNTECISTTEYSNKTIKEIVQYLNNHYTEEITLDMLSEQFFISKSHLCKAFHHATGLTVFKYIGLKRLTLVQSLYAKGMSLLDASVHAGFNNYSSFYRAYMQEYGTKPTSHIK